MSPKSKRASYESATNPSDEDVKNHLMKSIPTASITRLLTGDGSSNLLFPMQTVNRVSKQDYKNHKDAIMMVARTWFDLRLLGSSLRIAVVRGGTCTYKIGNQKERMLGEGPNIAA